MEAFPIKVSGLPNYSSMPSNNLKPRCELGSAMLHNPLQRENLTMPKDPQHHQ